MPFKKRRNFLKFFTVSSIILLCSSGLFLIMKIFLFPLSRKKTVSTISESKIKEGINEFDGDKFAVINKSDRFIIISTVCTHLGCTVKWNPQKSVFECPCHRSIFSENGKVLKGPAKNNLKRLRFQKRNKKVIVWL